MKHIKTEIKETLDGINNRLGDIEKSISNWKMKITQTDKQNRKKKKKLSEENLRDL